MMAMMQNLAKMAMAPAEAAKEAPWSDAADVSETYAVGFTRFGKPCDGKNR